MKRGILLLVLILLLPTIFAASIETNSEYKKGETIIAKVNANFVETVTKDDVKFYRDHVESPFDYDFDRIGGYYYIKASTRTKQENNYSIVIVGKRHYKAGDIVEVDIVSEFVINSEQAAFELDPGFILSSGNFLIDFDRLTDDPVEVSISNPDNIDSVESFSFGSSYNKEIAFQVGEITQNIEDSVTISGEGLTYSIPVFIFASDPDPVCGDGYLDPGESCDTDNWGEIKRM